MREPEAPVILACGHVEVRSGHCATTDCENYDVVDGSWHWTMPERWR